MYGRSDKPDTLSGSFRLSFFETYLVSEHEFTSFVALVFSRDMGVARSSYHHACGMQTAFRRYLQLQHNHVHANIYFRSKYNLGSVRTQAMLHL